MSSSNTVCYGDLFAPAPVCDPADVAVSPVAPPVFTAADSMYIVRSLTDAQGYTYLAGGTTTPIGDASLGTYAYSVWLLKLDPNGQVVWSRQLKSNEADQDYAVDLAFANNGDILFCGRSDVVDTNPEGVSSRFWIDRYDSAGNLIIADEAPAISGAGYFGKLFETPAGELQLWGSFAGSWTVGSTTIQAGGSSQGVWLWQGFRLRFSASGSVSALDRIGAADGDMLEDAVPDAAGMTYVALTTENVTACGSDPPHGALVALDPQLKVVWSRDLGEYTYTRRLAIDNGVLVTVGDAMSARLADGTSPDQLFVGQFQLGTGTPILWKSYPMGNLSGPFPWAVASLAVLPNSDIVIGGQMPAGATLGDSTLRSAMGFGAFLGRFTAAGDPVWATLYCSTGGAQVVSLDSGAGSLKAVVWPASDIEFGASHLGPRHLVNASSGVLIQLPADKIQ